MFAITWDFLLNDTNNTLMPTTAAGSNESYLTNNYIWEQWVGQYSSFASFKFDLGIDKPINSLVIYNHNIVITATICIILKDGAGNTVHNECYTAGTLDDGFGLMPFGLTGFGGYYEAINDVEPYNSTHKIFDTKHARYVHIYIYGLSEPPKIGYLNVGKTFIPTECTIDDLSVEYATNGVQTRSVAGSFYGTPSISYRTVILRARLFNYDDLLEFARLTVKRNTSELLFFTGLNSVTQDLSGTLKPLNTITTMMCYLDKDNYPKYSLGPSHSSDIALKLIEAL